MKKEIEKILKNALMSAEMRQGCTDYEPYVNALYDEIQGELQQELDKYKLVASGEVISMICYECEAGYVVGDKNTIDIFGELEGTKINVYIKQIGKANQ